MHPRHLALVALINLVWGINSVAVKLAVMSVSPLTATLLRFAIVAAVIAPFLRWIPGRMRAIGAVALCQGALHFGLLTVAFAEARNVAALAIVTQLGAPIALLLAVLFLGERIHWPRIAAIAVAFAGVVVIGFDPALLDERLSILLVLIAVSIYAAGSIVVRGLQGVSAVVIFAWGAVLSVPPLALAAWVFEPEAIAALPALSFSEWLPILFTAVGASLVGHLGVTWLTQRYPVSTVMPLFLPSPVIGAALATIVFGTPVTTPFIIGAVLVLAGVAVIALRTGSVPTNASQP